MFKQTLLASIALLSATIAAAQTRAPAQTTTPDQALAARTCELPKIADSAPLEQLGATNLVTVPIGINGIPKRFLLDIGLNRPTEISPDLKSQMGLPENPKQTELLQFGADGAAQKAYQGVQVPLYDVRDALGVGSVQTHVRIGSLSIGNATSRHMTVKVAEKWEIEKAAPYDGFISGDFFRQYDIDLDFAGKKITWLTPTKCTDPDQVALWPHAEVAILPVHLAADGRMQMQAAIKGRLIDVEIDTTAPRTVMRRDIADRYVGLTADKDMIPVGDLKDGRHMQVYIHTFPELNLGDNGVTLLNVPVLIQDFSMRPANSREQVTGHREDSERIPDLTIGMDVLRHLHLYVVPGQGRVYVTAAE